MVESTRGLFVVLTLVGIPLALLGPLSAATGTMRLVALTCAGVLAVSVVAGHLRGSDTFGMDVVDALAILGLALASQEPAAAALLIVFPALWFRSLYGSTSRAVLRCGLYVGACSAALPLYRFVPGHVASSGIGSLIPVFATMFLIVLMVRRLAGGVLTRHQAAGRDAVHASTGSQLLSANDAAEVRRIAWDALAAICATTPGLRVLNVTRDGSGLRVCGVAGRFADTPPRLPTTVLSVGGDQTRRRELIDRGRFGRVPSCPELDAAAGTTCAWNCLQLPPEHRQDGPEWLLLGAPQQVPADVIASVGSLLNVVTLALRNAQVHEELTVLASQDSLTGVANRASFNSALAAALDDDDIQQTTVLFVDIDDFKGVNDHFGHGAGDDLLKEVGARLRRATRPGDLCARLGGDEFAVMLPGTGGLAAAIVAQRIVESIAAPVHIGGGVTHVGASVGVATAVGQADLEQLIHRADVAMYAAKAGGKSRIQVFEPALVDADPAELAFGA